MPINLKTFFTLLLLALTQAGCLLIPSQPKPAILEKIKEDLRFCVNESMATPYFSGQCKNEDSLIQGTEISPGSNVYQLTALDQQKFFFTKLKFCGRANKPEAMLRQLFVGASGVQIKEVKSSSLNNFQVLTSRTELQIDDQKIYIITFSNYSECQHDWVYWSFSDDIFLPQKIRLLTQITEQLWHLN